MSHAAVATQRREAQRKEKPAGALVELCSVRLGKTLFGVPITHILEIVGGARPQPVPLAPGFVGGLVHYRGDVLTTVSLRRLLDLPPKEGAQALLVLESAGGCFGLLVDSVGEVVNMSPASYEPNPSILEERRRALFAGAYKLQEGLLIALDPERLEPLRLEAMGLDWVKQAQTGQAQTRLNQTGLNQTGQDQTGQDRRNHNMGKPDAGGSEVKAA